MRVVESVCVSASIPAHAAVLGCESILATALALGLSLALDCTSDLRDDLVTDIAIQTNC